MQSHLLEPLVEVDELAARRTLRTQIARLERELGGLIAESFPHASAAAVVAGAGGPRVLGLAELELLRDDLAARVAGTRERLSARATAYESNRVLIEKMLLEPRRYKWALVTNADIGESGCKSYRVVPRYGPVGLLLGWWRVKISSGCPLP